MPRTDPGTLSCDLLVAGAGLAGMTAAARAVSLGLKTVVAGSASSFSFYSGLMDFLGCWPQGNPVADPGSSLADLMAAAPAHPYALAANAWGEGPARIRKSFEFVADLLRDQGLAYLLPDRGNIPVITAMGTVKHSHMVPAGMAVEGTGVPGVLKGEERPLAVAGIQGLPGFSAAQVAGALGRERVMPVQVTLPGIRGLVPPQVLAQRLETTEARAAFLDQVGPRLKGAWACGVPAVLGLQNHGKILGEMARDLGCPLFEIPCAPPSVPGMRLKQAFDAYLNRAGATVLSNTRLADPVFDGRHFSLTARLEPEGRRIRARGVILATGRFFGSGLHARRERIVEPLFHLDVAQPVRRGLWHDTRFLSPQGHGINQAGIETDGLFRPLDERGRPVYRRLFAAGGILAGNDWPRLKSGAGVAITSAVTAVDAFFREAGHGT